eukprot:XP_008657406.1 formin-like protein 7 [Zea mays]
MAKVAPAAALTTLPNTGSSSGSQSSQPRPPSPNQQQQTGGRGGGGSFQQRGKRGMRGGRTFGGNRGAPPGHALQHLLVHRPQGPLLQPNRLRPSSLVPLASGRAPGGSLLRYHQQLWSSTGCLYAGLDWAHRRPPNTVSRSLGLSLQLTLLLDLLGVLRRPAPPGFSPIGSTSPSAAGKSTPVGAPPGFSPIGSISTPAAGTRTPVDPAPTGGTSSTGPTTLPGPPSPFPGHFLGKVYSRWQTNTVAPTSPPPSPCIPASGTSPPPSVPAGAVPVPPVTNNMA